MTRPGWTYRRRKAMPKYAEQRAERNLRDVRLLTDAIVRDLHYWNNSSNPGGYREQKGRRATARKESRLNHALTALRKQTSLIPLADDVAKFGQITNELIAACDYFPKDAVWPGHVLTGKRDNLFAHLLPLCKSFDAQQKDLAA